MTILPQQIPYIVKACKRPDGLIAYVLMNPHVVVYRPGCAARDEEQIIGRVTHLLPPWQHAAPTIHYIEAGAFERLKDHP